MRNWARSGLSYRSVSSMKFGMRSRSFRKRSWMSGRSAMIRSANESSRTVVSWPPVNRLAASSATSFTSGVVPSGKVAVAIAVMMSSRGVAAAVLDVGRELVVEELERLVLQVARAAW